jgi:hypothetical protein
LAAVGGVGAKAGGTGLDTGAGAGAGTGLATGEGSGTGAGVATGVGAGGVGAESSLRSLQSTFMRETIAAISGFALANFSFLFCCLILLTNRLAASHSISGSSSMTNLFFVSI